jgi:hypothetical protein
MEPMVMVERARAIVDLGYRALKVVFIPSTHYTASIRDVAHAGRMMEAALTVVGLGLKTPAPELALPDEVRTVEFYAAARHALEWPSYLFSGVQRIALVSPHRNHALWNRSLITARGSCEVSRTLRPGFG